MDTLRLLLADDGRILAAAGLVLSYVLLCVALRPRRRRADGNAAWRVVYASQTGQAEALARDTARALVAGGQSVQVQRLDEAWQSDLAPHSRVLFVVSTYGEGSAPDHAARFARALDSASPALRGLRYGLLALGDRSYASFCAFGRRLDRWLLGSGALPLFPPIEVDRLDAASMAAWQRAVAGLGAGPAWRKEPEGFADWRFAARELLNPGSPGASLCKVSLRPAGGPLPHWEAGDLVDLLPAGASGRPRSYSIASLPEDGRLELIVRTQRDAAGRPGLVSSWLNEAAVPGAALALRIRPNPGFRLVADCRVPLILIGAGSGFAGLRGHLKARARALAAAGLAPPARCAWLLFGERSARHDRLCAEEIVDWQASGLLSRCDRVFSRDEPGRPYVQHALLDQAAEVRAWVGAGACILVCGSAATMGQQVDAALRAILGDTEVDHLSESGRLRRDVY